MDRFRHLASQKRLPRANSSSAITDSQQIQRALKSPTQETLDPVTILNLQQVIGNQAVQRLVQQSSLAQHAYVVQRGVEDVPKPGKDEPRRQFAWDDKPGIFAGNPIEVVADDWSWVNRDNPENPLAGADNNDRLIAGNIAHYRIQQRLNNYTREFGIPSGAMSSHGIKHGNVEGKTKIVGYADIVDEDNKEIFDIKSHESPEYTDQIDRYVAKANAYTEGGGWTKGTANIEGEREFPGVRDNSGSAPEYSRPLILRWRNGSAGYIIYSWRWGRKPPEPKKRKAHTMVGDGSGSGKKQMSITSFFNKGKV